MDDDSLAETTDRDMLTGETLSMTSPPHNDNKLDTDLNEWAISSRRDLSNRNDSESVSLTSLESPRDGQIPNNKLDDSACAVPVDDTTGGVLPFDAKKDVQIAWGNIETRRRNLNGKRDKLKQLREERARREGEATHILRGTDATVDALVATSFHATLDHGKNTTLMTGSQAGSVHLTSGGGQEVRLVRLA